MKKLLLIQPGAFGDIFVCAPIAKWYANQGYEIYWPVTKKFVSTLNYFDYVNPIILSDEILHPDWLQSDVMKILPTLNQYKKVLNLADRGPHPTAQKVGLENFEQCKYRLSQVPIEEKNNLVWTRNFEKEKELEKLLNIKGDYCVAHLTNSHGDKAVVPEQELPLIEIIPIKGFNIPDWYSIIQKAKKVYCVESGVHQFIDGTLKTYSENHILLKKGPVVEGTRHTISKYWNMCLMGYNTKLLG
jgi:hypothetical protein